MKLKTINQRAEHAARCRRLKPGTVEWDWFCFGFKKGVTSSQRNRARCN